MPRSTGALPNILKSSCKNSCHHLKQEHGSETLRDNSLRQCWHMAEYICNKRCTKLIMCVNRTDADKPFCSFLYDFSTVQLWYDTIGPFDSIFTTHVRHATVFLSCILNINFSFNILQLQYYNHKNLYFCITELKYLS